MKKIAKKKSIKIKKGPTADEIAEMADRGENILKYFSTSGVMVRPVKKLEIEISGELLDEIDKVASKMNVDRAAAVSFTLQEGLNYRGLMKKILKEVA